MDLTSASVVVTGGSGLLGSAAVRRFVARGAQVVVLDLDVERNATLVARCPGVLALACDITSPQDVVAALRAATDLAPLRVVLNAAGTGFVRRVLDREGRPHDLDSFRATLEVHAVGFFNVLSQAAAVMAAQDPLDEGERGVIINTSSLAGLEGSSGQIAYGTAKAAVAGMTLIAARDLGFHGIRVLGIAPNGMSPDEAFSEGQAPYERILAAIPYPARWGRPEEYAHLVECLVDNRYLNGQVVRLDGGGRLPMR